MKSAEHDRAESGKMAGHRLRCFLNAGLLLFLVIGSSGAKAGYAMTCASPPKMTLSKLQGTVYGPSGFPVPLIMIRIEEDGEFVAQTQTDGKGKFEAKVAPGTFDVRVQFLDSKSMDLDVRVRHSAGFFHTARLQIVLGLSGTRCNFATTNTKEFKKAIKRYKSQLEERQN